MTAYWTRCTLRGVGVFALALGVGCLVACTKANPNYDPGLQDGAAADQLGPVPDGGPRADRGPAVDRGRRDVGLPDPDLPTGCSKNSDCDDGVPCTDDRCDKGSCTYPLKSGFCSIDGVCYQAGDLDPKNSCHSCQPNTTAVDWTAGGDGSPCAQDGLWCTEDVCKAGVCSHEVTQGCAIGGACLAAGATKPGNGCVACEPSVDRSAYTSLDGAPCGATSQGLCIESACRSLTAATPPALAAGSRASLTAVAYQPQSKQVWAGGEVQKSSGTGSTVSGLFLRLDSAGAGKLQSVTNSVRAMSSGVAVQGNVFSVYSTTTASWGVDSDLAKALGYRTRHGVWGRQLAGQDIYYFSGLSGGSSPGVLRCTRGSASWSCKKHSGFDNNTTINAVVGTVGPAGLGALWAVPFSGYEHIYANDGIATAWSRKAPKGCTDSNSSPCQTSFYTDFADLHASSASDVWAVGEGGMVMRFDGTAWKRFDSVVQYQQFYDFDAVYSAAATPVTVIVGHRDLSYGRYVSLFTYNRKLDRWWGPITIEKRFDKPLDDALVRDIDGAGAADLWLVGHRTQNSGRKPWALHLH
jgi:hypothetical protein